MGRKMGRDERDCLDGDRGQESEQSDDLEVASVELRLHWESVLSILSLPVLDPLPGIAPSSTPFGEIF